MVAKIVIMVIKKVIMVTKKVIMVIKLLLRQWYKTIQQDNATRQLIRKKLASHSDNNYFSMP